MTTTQETSTDTTTFNPDMPAAQKRQAEIDKLRAKANQADADVRRQTYERIQDLLAARDTVSDQLSRLRDASQSTWAEILHKTDDAFQSFSHQFHSFVKDQG